MEQSRRECTGNASEYGVPLFMTQAFMLLALNFYQLIFVSVVYQASKFPHGAIYFFLTKLIGGIFAGKKNKNHFTGHASFCQNKICLPVFVFVIILHS